MEYITNLCRAKMKDSNEWCVGYYVKGTEKFKTDENSISFELIDPDGYGIHVEAKIENVREKE